MITSCDTQEYIPFGREFMSRHPGQFQIKQKCGSQIFNQGISIISSFKEISLQDSIKTTGLQKESWIFREHESDADEFDEELYVNGATVVWSRGSQGQFRAVVKSFTMGSPVIQALWASFVISPGENTVNSSSSMGTKGKEQKGICVVESNIVSFFINEGGEYSSALPFQASRTWQIKNGLLFERTLTYAEMKAVKKNCPSQTIIFSMLHPLDEVAPVITRTSVAGGAPKVSWFTDSNVTIIFTSCEPSIAIVFDSQTGLHSVWRIRRVRPEEITILTASWDNTSFLYPTPFNGRSGLNSSSSFSQQFAANMSQSHSSSFSPLRSFTGKVMSPSGIMRTSPAQVNKTHYQSPASTNPALYRYHTPSPLVRSPGMFMHPGSPHNSSYMGNESFGVDIVSPLQPSVCLEHLWSEPSPPTGEKSMGKASKVFLTEDLCGQQFLCLMVPYRQQLRCLKFEESNDGSQLIFGSVTVLHAKDSIPIKSQHMLLVLETSGTLVLYTGTTRISQIHIPVLPLGSNSGSLLRSSMTPFGSPMRGEVFTSSRPPSAMDIRLDDEMIHISPVSANLEDSAGQLDCSLGGMAMVTPGSCFIQNLRDNVGKKFSAELLNGCMVRTELPPMTDSFGIDLCLKALKYLLPKDVALQVLGRWYTTRNSPGSVGNVSEWQMFYKCILGMMGFDTSKLNLTSSKDGDGSVSPILQSKKPKPSDQGANEDWDYLFNSQHHHLSDDSRHLFGLTGSITDSCWQSSRPCSINSSSLLFPFCPVVLLALHLVYEELKLNILLHKDLASLAPLVHQIACDLKCDSYSDSYRRDYPDLFKQVDDLSQVTEDDLRKMQYPQVFPTEVPSVTAWISRAISPGPPPQTMIYIPVCETIRKVIIIYTVMTNRELPIDKCMHNGLKKIAPAGHRAPTAETSISSHLSKVVRMDTNLHSQAQALVLTMAELDITLHDLDCLPIGLSVPMREACLLCRAEPSMDWPEKVYTLIGRQDLSALASITSSTPCYNRAESAPREREDLEKEDEDGMEHLDEEVLKLRFPKDLRVQEVRRLLQSARPVIIAIKQRPEVNDHDFIEEQEKALLATCVRTMALPVGRGIFTLHTCQPLLTETLPIPKLCLTGKSPPRNTTVDFTRIEVPANMSVWPQFHNGVAAGLRIASSVQVNSAWIIYNKPKELTNEFGGFLMALGLNGHLPKLCTFNIHEYISEGNELVTIGILLGMSAAKRGSMDQTVIKALGVHISALLPPTSVELNIAHNTRVAAILGVGLLYQGTGHLYMAEVMLSEIGRPPGPEMENCVDRDSYALSAGLSLGLIMFGKGNQTMGMSDLSMADLLCHLMVGGHNKPMLWPNRDRVHKAPSFLIKEGDRVNVDVTSPGATMALGMIFFNTKNSAVSEWLMAPQTQFMLDQVRPDFLCLRTISFWLVNWDAIVPSSAWIEGNLPEIVKKYAFYKRQANPYITLDPSVDLQTMSQAHCNITSGACLVLAMKFAGSANREAFKTLLDSLGGSLKLLGDQTLLDQTGRSTVENCISVKVLSLAILMAGTGDLVTLRICRALRRRVGSQYHQFTYGNHMCISMAIGLLFLGGGKFSLKTTPEAVGAMLCAFYPQWPISSSDNKYHLQAFRHLYALACEPRLLIPRDVDTGEFCFLPLNITFKRCPSYGAEDFGFIAPYMLPELSKFQWMRIQGERYWSILFRDGENWDTLKLLLEKGGILPVKKRAGHLSYKEDPKGNRSGLAQILSIRKNRPCPFTKQPDIIKSFTCDPKITVLTDIFIKPEDSDNSIIQALSSAIYQCVMKEKAEAVCPNFVLEQLGLYFADSQCTLGLQQIKMVMSYYNSVFFLLRKSYNDERVFQSEFLYSLKYKIDELLDRWFLENESCLMDYIHNEVKGHSAGYLSHFLLWFSVPSRDEISDNLMPECPPLPVMYTLFPEMNGGGLLRLRKIFSSQHH